jgi:hypothetical protein
MITLLRPWGRRAGKTAKIEPSMPAPAVLFTFTENIAVRAGHTLTQHVTTISAIVQ